MSAARFHVMYQQQQQAAPHIRRAAAACALQPLVDWPPPAPLLPLQTRPTPSRRGCRCRARGARACCTEAPWMRSPRLRRERCGRDQPLASLWLWCGAQLVCGPTARRSKDDVLLHEAWIAPALAPPAAAPPSTCEPPALLKSPATAPAPKQGVPGFYRGFGGILLTVIPANCCYFRWPPESLVFCIPCPPRPLLVLSEAHASAAPGARCPAARTAGGPGPAASCQHHFMH